MNAALASGRYSGGRLDCLPLPKVTATALGHARAHLGVRPMHALFDQLRR